GLKFGSILEWYISENFSVNSGINLSFNKGGKLLFEQGGDFLANSELSNEALHRLPPGVNIRYAIQFIEIPLSVKFRTNEKNFLRYYFELPIFELAFRTRARANINGTDISVSDEIINKDINLLNIFYGLGAGIEYSLSEHLSVQGGLYFSSSFFDTTSNDGKTEIEDQGNIILIDEDSKGILNSITLRIAILF
ncbi:MAG: outer membrane beta-barrel protein, partial [Bacteroidota bacterium]